MKNWLVVFLAILAGHVYGQGSNNYIPPSPNASALMRGVDIPVNYYTGAADVSVPLFNLGGRDISIPIGLNYNASGIKVQDVASSVGIGWNLNAGGMITRMVRGEPDGSVVNCTDTWTNSAVVAGTCDYERDIFYFSMLGRSGKFFMDPVTGIFHSMPYQDVKITVVTDIPSGYWQIIDENGYKYQFGVTTTECEQSTYYTWNTTTNSYAQQDTYISTWYLSKIFSPLGVQVATFTYIGANAYEYELFSQSQVLSANTCTPTAGPIVNTNVKVRINQGKYLIAISTSLGTVSFDYS